MIYTLDQAVMTWSLDRTLLEGGMSDGEADRAAKYNNGKSDALIP